MVLIPSFAVDRTEVILFHLRRLVRAGRVPEVTVYVDSPMALDALRIYRRALAGGSPELRPLDADGGEDPLDPGSLIEAHKVDESKAIHEQELSSIIISASGMATGGRVLHHLARRLPDPRNTVILVGFQAAQTRGRALADGAHAVKLLGRYVPVRAEIVNVSGFSVHADCEEILSWLRTAPRPPEATFVVHGELPAAKALQASIENELGWTVAVPRDLEQVRLD
jgi:metallo-beta-lactamase family protein